MQKICCGGKKNIHKVRFNDNIKIILFDDLDETTDSDNQINQINQINNFKLIPKNSNITKTKITYSNNCCYIFF